MNKYKFCLSNKQKGLLDKVLSNSKYSTLQEYFDGSLKQDTKWIKDNPNKPLVSFQ